MSKAKFHVPKKLEHNVRMQAVNIIYQVFHNQAYSNMMIQKAPVAIVDRTLLAEIVYGTISQHDYLSYQLQPFLKRQIDDWVEIILLTAIFQMTQLDRVPDHAILNESVEIAKAVGNPGVAKFVNGVLRQIQRQGVRTYDEVQDATERLSLQMSMPRWLVEQLLEAYGVDVVQNLADDLLVPSYVSARVVAPYKRSNIIGDLQEEGYEVEPSNVSPVGIVGKKGYLAGSQAFKEGKITIQDESSQLVAPALAVEPDSHVLDACAAPGGKSAHIASYLEREKNGKLIALDIHQHKLKLIKENVERLHVADVVEAKQLDARHVNEMFAPQTFDRILVDAPCSGIGLIRRKPDIKYAKTAQDIARLPEIQLAILNSVAEALKVGGYLVYSTCTILPAENEHVVEAFLAEHPEFELDVVPNMPDIANKNGMCVLLPHYAHTDGFFIARLRKVREVN